MNRERVTFEEPRRPESLVESLSDSLVESTESARLSALEKSRLPETSTVETPTAETSMAEMMPEHHEDTSEVGQNGVNIQRFASRVPRPPRTPPSILSNEPFSSPNPGAHCHFIEPADENAIDESAPIVDQVEDERRSRFDHPMSRQGSSSCSRHRSPLPQHHVRDESPPRSRRSSVGSRNKSPAPAGMRNADDPLRSKISSPLVGVQE